MIITSSVSNLASLLEILCVQLVGRGQNIGRLVPLIPQETAVANPSLKSIECTATVPLEERLRRRLEGR